MMSASTISEMRTIILDNRFRGNRIGLVPTMGFLHAGHQSLIKRARSECDYVVVSVFVNPIQFGPNEDYDRYPRNVEQDFVLCERAGVDIIFIPKATEMYPSRNLAFVDIRELDDHLCGSRRPDHFQGVCTIVAKLFNICQPNRAYFGEKDAQQLEIIRRMTDDLNFSVEIVGCPIVREADGLALSSRNMYLDATQRKAALAVPGCLAVARHLLDKGDRDSGCIIAAILAHLENEPMASADYVEIVDIKTLQPVSRIESTVLVAVAVCFDKTRLIDNFTYTPPKGA